MKSNCGFHELHTTRFPAIKAIATLSGLLDQEV